MASREKSRRCRRTKEGRKEGRRIEEVEGWMKRGRVTGRGVYRGVGGRGWFWGRRERAGEGSRIDSAARVELRLCFGAVPCYVPSLRMRRISSLAQSRLFASPCACVSVCLRLCAPYCVYTIDYVRDITPRTCVHTRAAKEQRKLGLLDGTRRDGTKRDGTARDGTGRHGTIRDGTK